MVRGDKRTFHYRIEYWQNGVKKVGYATAYQGVLPYISRHTGPHPIRFFLGSQELVNTGKRLTPKVMPSAESLLGEVAPFSSEKL